MSTFLQDLAREKMREHVRNAATMAAIADDTLPAKPAFSFAKLLGALQSGGLRDGFEFEVCSEAARAAGKAHDLNRPLLPWHALRASRAVAAAADEGGYLVGTSNVSAVDVLRPWSTVQRAGVSVVSGLQGNVTIPRTTATTTAYWLSDELAPITESAPTLGQISMTPKTCGALVEVSRMLERTAPQLDAYISRELTRTVATAIDQAVLNGSGNLGQPAGVLAAPIGTHSGASLSYAGLRAMQETAASANADDAMLAVIAAPGVRTTLSTRERATGSGFTWDAGRVVDAPAFVTSDMPSATLILGDWSQVLVGLWGPGVALEVNPYDADGFKRGSVQVRVMVSVDVAVRQPAAFVSASSIT